ncbi:MAG TPA: AAA family ATPase [Micromonosporaceae bacterium]|nr:AAA family ATPase [Micromonosporaceae bacterium]
MSADLFFRAEDLRREDIHRYLVETTRDRSIIDQLKGGSPIVLKGSRGVGKSFLLKAAEAELVREFEERRVLPVYVTFATAGLLNAPTGVSFLAWMIAKICNRIVRASATLGVTMPDGTAVASIRAGGSMSHRSRLETVEQDFENSWRSRKPADTSTVPEAGIVLDAVEDLCVHAKLTRVVLLIDEAAHVFIPEQQRQFFTLMRNLRSPYVVVKAAVYPGTTSFGPHFQPTHDAAFLSLDRAVTDDGYSDAMREIVRRQSQPLARAITQYGEDFDTVAFAATGNPRVLLKILSRGGTFNRRNIQESMKEYYRNEIWAEHSDLAARYRGHTELIDWGRRFIQGAVLPEHYARNTKRSEQISTIWIHRDAPVAARAALQLLCYSGILQEGPSGIKSRSDGVGTRYIVNFGCQFAMDSDPVQYGLQVRVGLSISRSTEYGMSHASFESLGEFALSRAEQSVNRAYRARLKDDLRRLDLTRFQRSKLDELGLNTIGDVLSTTELSFKRAAYVGPVRARQIRNAALAAVLEYLTG